jgi:hypothetical protein
MGANRAFLAQEALDLWLADGRVSLEGETLRLLPEGIELRLSSAVCFKSEVAGGGDVQALVGKVKTVEDVTALSGEHVSGSVVLGDDAYEVVDGFLADLQGDANAETDTALAEAAYAALVRLGSGD